MKNQKSPRIFQPVGREEKVNEMLGEFFRDNGYYKRSKGSSFFAAFKDSQHPRVTFVGYFDSRFQLGAVNGFSDSSGV